MSPKYNLAALLGKRGELCFLVSTARSVLFSSDEMSFRFMTNVYVLMLQVHKFSKFIHGTATLLPDMVQAVPYWVDDESLRPSINSSTAQPIHAPA